MKAKSVTKSERNVHRHQKQPILDVLVIPAPTILWHPSISLEKLISDFAEYQESIIVS
jgi:hypothetical protein